MQLDDSTDRHCVRANSGAMAHDEFKPSISIANATFGPQPAPARVSQMAARAKEGLARNCA